MQTTFLLNLAEDQTTTARTRRSRGFRRFGDVFGPVRTFLDAFGNVRMRSEVIGLFRNFRKKFALVSNTGEANDEMCAPTAPIISEMCALMLKNNHQLRR